MQTPASSDVNCILHGSVCVPANGRCADAVLLVSGRRRALRICASLRDAGMTYRNGFAGCVEDPRVPAARPLDLSSHTVDRLKFAYSTPKPSIVEAVRASSANQPTVLVRKCPRQTSTLRRARLKTDNWVFSDVESPACVLELSLGSNGKCKHGGER